MKTTIYLFIAAVLFLVIPCKSFGQNILKYTLGFDFEMYNQIHSVSENKYLDYLNAIDEYPDAFIDEANIHLFGHVWTKSDWEFDLNFGFQSDLKARQLNVYATKRFNHWGINLGMGNELFFLYEIENYYKTLEKTFVMRPDYLQYHLSLFGPYVGLNYELEQKRLLITGNINSGIQWNNALNQSVLLKEQNSNFIQVINYDTKSTPSFWIAPSIKMYFSIIKTDQFALGTSFEYRYYYTPRKLKYEQSTYEWTIANTEIIEPKQDLHHIQKHSFSIGLFLTLFK